jgi:hypothetical protein
MNKTKLLKLAQELSREGNVDSIPNGYYTRLEIEKMLNRGTDYVCRFLKELQQNKPDQIITKRYKIRNASGGISSIPHYKIKL